MADRVMGLTPPGKAVFSLFLSLKFRSFLGRFRKGDGEFDGGN